MQNLQFIKLLKQLILYVWKRKPFSPTSYYLYLIIKSPYLNYLQAQLASSLFQLKLDQNCNCKNVYFESGFVSQKEETKILSSR